MGEKAETARFSDRAGHAFPAYQAIGSMRGFSGGKNDAAIEAACEKLLPGNSINARRSSQFEEEESL